MKRIITGIIIVVLLAAGAMVVIVNNKNDNKMSNMQNKTTQPATSGPVTTDKITIQNFAFVQSKVIVHKGDTITWTNLDEAHHNVNITSGPEKSEGPLLAKGETYKKTFSQVGTYAYHCTPHPYMEATIEVQA